MGIIRRPGPLGAPGKVSYPSIPTGSVVRNGTVVMEIVEVTSNV